jgi:hypothetical protein
VVFCLPVNALPPVVLVNAVLFVTKQLNLLPLKGGIPPQFSPKQIMTGKVVHYKFCSIPFGQYCQISEEGSGIVLWHGHRVPLQSDPVAMSRGGINFTLCTRQVLWYDRIGKHFQCPSL